MRVDAPKQLWTPSPEIHERLLLTGAAGVITVSGPMGGGKSGVRAAIMDFVQPYDRSGYGMRRKFSVSKTSRQARPGETGGVDYDFDIDAGWFKPAFDRGELLEHDYHADNHYGTPMPQPGEPLLLEIEPAGLRAALLNRREETNWFRAINVAVYVAQASMGQLIEQIMGRPDDTINEQKKLARACRYPGELAFIIDNGLPYSAVQNVPGKPEEAQVAALRVIAGDPEAPVLGTAKLHELFEEACDHLNDIGLEPVWLDAA